MKVSILQLSVLAWIVLLAAACTVTPAPAITDALVCTDDIRCVAVEEGELINIASMIVNSGPVAFLGTDQIGAIEIAVADYGPIHGHEIALRQEDSLCSAEGGQTAAQKVAANPNIIGVLGTACSSAATAALPIISKAGLSMISSSNTSPTLTDPDRDAGGVWQPGYYRTAHNDLFQGKLAAEYAYNELGARTVATVHDGSPYAYKLQEVMAIEFTNLGGAVTHQGAVNVGDTDMRPLLTEVASRVPDLLFFPIFQPEGNFIVVQSEEISGLENMILMGADGLFSQDFPGNTGVAAVDMYLTAPSVQNEAYTELLRKWADLHGGGPPSAFHAHAYDATTMLLDAISAVAQVDANGNLLIGLQAIRDYLNSVEGFDGITGTLTCGTTGDCATGEGLAVFQITEAELEGEWPPKLVFQP